MNVTISQKLPEIFSLAHDRSDESRLRLANLLADVFMEDGVLNDREQLILNEIIDELIGNAPPLVRQMLAQRLCTARQVPHRVLLSLACDQESAVAVPVLKSAPLKDEDLIFVVEAHGREHALAIAERQQISEAVADALISTGDVDVMVSVAENLGATISPHGMQVLVEAARFGQKLQEKICQRPDLTADMGLQLYWWLETELRRTTLKRFNISSGQTEEALERTITEMLTSVEADRNDPATMEKVAQWFDDREAITSRVLIQCLRMGFFKLFEVMLARRAGFEVDMATRMVAEDGGRPLAVLCRLLGVDKASFVSIFLLSRGARPGEQIVNPRELSQAIAAFDRVDGDSAQQILESWKQNPEYLLHHLKQANN
ncbi:MAG TPA: DUF2336 domain-containing protein [Alphaproteobacteria bacterium]|nr:DUF2336 domain-containing protein [Alphaproteobacteria bacterium]